MHNSCPQTCIFFYISVPPPPPPSAIFFVLAHVSYPPAAKTYYVLREQEVDLEDYVNRPEKVSAADISAIAQEAGLQAVRKNRYVVLGKDLDKAYKKHVNKHDTEHAFYSM